MQILLLVMFYFSFFLLVHDRNWIWKHLRWKVEFFWLPPTQSTHIQLYTSGPFLCQSWCCLLLSLFLYLFLFFQIKYSDCFDICSGGYFIHLWKACKLLKPPLKLCNWMGLLILVWKYKLFIVGFNLKVGYVIPMVVYIAFWWNWKHKWIPLGFVRDLQTQYIWRLSFYFFKYVIFVFASCIKIKYRLKRESCLVPSETVLQK